jgi:hypothetical protein
MAKGPVTEKGKANISAGMRERYARLQDKTDFADAVAEAVHERPETPVIRIVREFARERPTSSVVRLMFPVPEGDDAA